MIRQTHSSTGKKTAFYPGMMRTYGVDDVRYGGKTSESYLGKGLTRLVKMIGGSHPLRRV